MVILQTAVEKQFGLDKRFSYIHSKKPGKKKKYREMLRIGRGQGINAHI